MNKESRVNIEFHRWDDLDINTLAEISADARRVEGLGDYTYEQMVEYLQTMNERFPVEIIATAAEGETIVGWMGVERVTESIGEIGRWQPYVLERRDKQKVARSLISAIVGHAKSNGMTRVEVAFGGISEENLDTFNDRISCYEKEGWSKLEDTNFMECNPTESIEDDIQVPEGFEVQPLLDFDNDTIFLCYHDAFTTGNARWIFDMTEEQRREEFDKVFDRTRQINEESSLSLLSEGTIIGFILIVSRSNDEEHLESIGVKPKYRGMGLGKILLSKSLKILGDQQVQRLTLGVDPVNTPAVSLYNQFGFETASRIARYSWKSINP